MRKYAAMGLTAVLVAASFPAAVLADEADVKSVRIGAPYDPVTMDYAELNVDPATYIDTLISDTLIKVSRVSTLEEQQRAGRQARMERPGHLN